MTQIHLRSCFGAVSGERQQHILNQTSLGQSHFLISLRVVLVLNPHLQSVSPHFSWLYTFFFIFYFGPWTLLDNTVQIKLKRLIILLRQATCPAYIPWTFCLFIYVFGGTVPVNELTQHKRDTHKCPCSSCTCFSGRGNRRTQRKST